MDNDVEGKVWSAEDLAQLREMMKSFASVPPSAPIGRQKQSFMDFTINVQAVVVIVLSAILGVGWWGITNVISYQAAQTKNDTAVAAIQGQLTAMALDNKNMADQLNLIRQGTIQFRDQIAKWQADSSMQNLDQQKQLAALDKSVAVIQERLADIHSIGPHGELSTPEKMGSLERPK